MFKKIQALIKGGKGGYEMLVPKIKKELKKRRETKEDIFKSVDEKAGKNVDASVKAKIKQDASKKVSAIYDKYEDATKKAKGGRVGLKFGSRKSNVQKIQETFGPKKKLSPKQMKIAKQAGDPNKIEGVDFKKLQQKRKV